jgi:hypothetical protein
VAGGDTSYEQKCLGGDTSYEKKCPDLRCSRSIWASGRHRFNYLY